MFHEQIVQSITELEESVPGQTRLLRQLSDGPFEGTHARLELAGMALHRETANRRFLMETRGPRNGQVVFFHSRRSGGARVRGEWIAPGGAGYYISGEDRQTSVREGLEVFCLMLPEDSLPLREREAIHAPDDRIEELAGWFSGLLARAAEDGPRADADLMAIAPGLIHDQLTLWLDQGADWRRPRSLRTAGIWRMVREILSAREGEPITVLELAREIGLPAQTLRAAVLEQTDCRLDDILVIQRLNLAHRDLLEAGPEGRTVSDIATSRGFYHLGRFSRRYRAFFGELPSDVRARAPNRRPAPAAGDPSRSPSRPHADRGRAAN